MEAKEELVGLPTYENVIKAAERLKGVANKTPVMTSRTLNE